MTNFPFQYTNQAGSLESQCCARTFYLRVYQDYPQPTIVIWALLDWVFHLGSVQAESRTILSCWWALDLC